MFLPMLADLLESLDMNTAESSLRERPGNLDLLRMMPCNSETSMKGHHEKDIQVVRGGVAYVQEDTVPPGYVAEVIDFDNIEGGGDFPSEEARRFCVIHDLL